MPAIIRILAGPGSGREHWIDSPVMRIGSHPDCELCLPSPEIPPHACTLEFRNKQYVLLNRSQQPFRIGNRTIEKQSKDVWSSGEQLEILGLSALTLHLDKDPTPCPKPVNVEKREKPSPQDLLQDREEGQSESNVSNSKPGFSTKEMVQLAVTIACCLGIVAIIALKSMPQKAEDKIKDEIRLSDVFKDKNSAESKDDSIYQSLFVDLQEAGVMRSKGNLSAANLKLTKIRDALHQKRNSEGTFDELYDDRLYRYVSRILVLTKPASE